jgi:dihydrofolate synthase/folylpolyglutamate synthase
MKAANRQPIRAGISNTGKQRNYNEIVELLDGNWKINAQDPSLSCMKKLDQAFEYPSKKLSTVFVAGSNGKSLTINFAAQLLRQEGLAVGAFYAPHILTYNERITVNNETITNKIFTELANDVINTAESLDLSPNSFEILTIIALIYFVHEKVDVAILESAADGYLQATRICSPKVIAITRVTTDDEKKTDGELKKLLTLVESGCHVVSADQSKLHLQTMLELSEQKGAIWAMPIRKLAALHYPFEQLHGRCAALAERIAQIYVNEFANQNAIILNDSLLTKQKGQRGRPTLEAKRKSELNPKKTVDQFWKEVLSTLPGRFQLLEKEKPSLLLDSANNLDAFENLLLGIRLLHYQRPFKGLTLIIGCNNQRLNTTQFLRSLRYFFKKTSGQAIICPVARIPGQRADDSWDVEKITNDLKSLKIKARSAKNFKEAFEMASNKSLDEQRYGLVVVTGSEAIITEYWRHKGIKKL